MEETNTNIENRSLTLSIGPHNPATIGPLRIKVQTDGEIVFSGEPGIGYLHRGIEKIAERKTWTGFIPYTDRIDYLASIHCNLAYALAVESLAGITVPERSQYVRVIVSELNRIASHLLSIGYLSQLLGSKTAMMYVLREREKINNLFEMLAGSRLTYSYIRIGGVAADITDGFVERTYEFLSYLVPKLHEYSDLLSSNYFFCGRLAHLGTLTPAQAIDAGVSGPNLRATGSTYDLRKASPYSLYDRFDFDVPVGSGEVGTIGDAFDRYQVRLREINQSLAIIRQALDGLPSGEFQAPQPRLFKAPAGEAYAAVESPRGVLGAYVSSNGEKYPYRVRFRTPSFAVLNLFPDILKNVLLSDVSTIVSSFDVMVSEVDR